MFSIAEKLMGWRISLARSKDGLSQDEARKLFFQFRKKNVEPPEEPDSGGDPQPQGSGGGQFSAQMNSFMRETSQKLDRIENDIDYLKQQVDQILKKI